MNLLFWNVVTQNHKIYRNKIEAGWSANLSDVKLDLEKTAIIKLLLVKNNQFISSKNWKSQDNELKKQSKNIEQLKTNNDQNKEKFLIKIKLLFSIKKIKIAPIKGNTIKEDNI